MAEPQSNPEKNTNPSFFRRVGLAFGTFFRTFSDADYASRIDKLRHAAEQPPAPEKPPEEPLKAASAPPPPLREATPDAALQLLSLLQSDARLIDFAMEDLTGYADAQIGAAARVVHDGCRKVLKEHFTIEPVRSETEGARVTLAEGFDAAAIRLTGNVVGKPPFLGRITHRGWRATDIRLPKLAESHDAKVLAPAEVEL